MSVIIFWHGLSLYHPLNEKGKQARSTPTHCTKLPLQSEYGFHPCDGWWWRHIHSARPTVAPPSRPTTVAPPSRCPTDGGTFTVPDWQPPPQGTTHTTPRPRAGGDRSVCKDEHIDDVASTVLHFPADGAASVGTCSATWIVSPNRIGPHSSKLADPGFELPTQRWSFSLCHQRNGVLHSLFDSVSYFIHYKLVFHFKLFRSDWITKESDVKLSENILLCL